MKYYDPANPDIPQSRRGLYFFDPLSGTWARQPIFGFGAETGDVAVMEAFAVDRAGAALPFAGKPRGTEFNVEPMTAPYFRALGDGPTDTWEVAFEFPSVGVQAGGLGSVFDTTVGELAKRGHRVVALSRQNLADDANAEAAVDTRWEWADDELAKLAEARPADVEAMRDRVTPLIAGLPENLAHKADKEADDKGWVDGAGNAMANAAYDYMVATGRRPSRIVAHDWVATQVAHTLKEAFGIPFGVHIHAIEPDKENGKLTDPQLARKYTEELRRYRDADFVFVNSPHMKAAAQRLYGIPAGRITVVPNGTDLKMWLAARDHERREQVLAKRNLQDRKFVLYFGRGIEVKGVRDAIEAMPDVKAAFADYPLVSAGFEAAMADEWLTPLIEGAELTAADVQRLGFLDRAEVLRFLVASAAVVVFPSRWEPFGVVVNEAAAAGTPMIATPWFNFVENGRTGLTVPTADPKALARAIKRILRYPEKADQMARNAQAKAQDPFYAWENIVGSKDEVYAAIGADSAYPNIDPPAQAAIARNGNVLNQQRVYLDADNRNGWTLTEGVGAAGPIANRRPDGRDDLGFYWDIPLVDDATEVRYAIARGGQALAVSGETELVGRVKTGVDVFESGVFSNQVSYSLYEDGTLVERATVAEPPAAAVTTPPGRSISERARIDADAADDLARVAPSGLRIDADCVDAVQAAVKKGAGTTDSAGDHDADSRAARDGHVRERFPTGGERLTTAWGGTFYTTSPDDLNLRSGIAETGLTMDELAIAGDEAIAAAQDRIEDFFADPANRDASMVIHTTMYDPTNDTFGSHAWLARRGADGRVRYIDPHPSTLAASRDWLYLPGWGPGLDGVVAVDVYGVRPDAQGMLHGVELPGLQEINLSTQRPDAHGMPGSAPNEATRAPYSRIERLARDVAEFAHAVRNGSALSELDDTARAAHLARLDDLREQSEQAAAAVRLAVAQGDDATYRPAIVERLSRFERDLSEYQGEHLPAEVAERLDSWDFFWHLDIQANPAETAADNVLRDHRGLEAWRSEPHQLSVDPDRAPWGEASTVAELGEVTARWLQRDLATARTPEAETGALAGVLTAVNRAGFVTRVSQPGARPGSESTQWWNNFGQRAAVAGLSTSTVRDRLLAAAADTGLRMVSWKLGEGPVAQDHVVVSDRGDWVHSTKFGHFHESKDELRSVFADAPVVDELWEDGWQIVIVDPEWGRNDRLWPMLERFAAETPADDWVVPAFSSYLESRLAGRLSDTPMFDGPVDRIAEIAGELERHGHGEQRFQSLADLSPDEARQAIEQHMSDGDTAVVIAELPGGQRRLTTMERTTDDVNAYSLHRARILAGFVVNADGNPVPIPNLPRSKDFNHEPMTPAYFRALPGRAAAQSAHSDSDIAARGKAKGALLRVVPLPLPVNATAIDAVDFAITTAARGAPDKSRIEAIEKRQARRAVVPFPVGGEGLVAKYGGTFYAMGRDPMQLRGTTLGTLAAEGVRAIANAQGRIREFFADPANHNASMVIETTTYNPATDSFDAHPWLARRGDDGEIYYLDPDPSINAASPDWLYTAGFGATEDRVVGVHLYPLDADADGTVHPVPLADHMASDEQRIAYAAAVLARRHELLAGEPLDEQTRAELQEHATREVAAATSRGWADRLLTGRLRRLRRNLIQAAADVAAGDALSTVDILARDRQEAAEDLQAARQTLAVADRRVEELMDSPDNAAVLRASLALEMAVEDLADCEAAVDVLAGERQPTREELLVELTVAEAAERARIRQIQQDLAAFDPDLWSLFNLDHPVTTYDASGEVARQAPDWQRRLVERLANEITESGMPRPLANALAVVVVNQMLADLEPGHDDNCVSVVDTALMGWFGLPDAAPVRTHDGYADGKPNQSLLLGQKYGAQYLERMHNGRFQHIEPNDWAAVHQQLDDAGRGSAAVVSLQWHDGTTHTTLVLYDHNGEFHYLDSGYAQASEKPFFGAGQIAAMGAFVLNAEREPVPFPNRPRGLGNAEPLTEIYAAAITPEQRERWPIELAAAAPIRPAGWRTELAEFGWSDDERELFAHLRDLSPGSDEHDELREMLIEHYFPLVEAMAQGYGSRSREAERYGAVALGRAVDEFKLDWEMAFPKFALPLISGWMRKQFRQAKIDASTRGQRATDDPAKEERYGAGPVPDLEADQIVKVIEALKFEFLRQNGTSHAIYGHKSGATVSIPMHTGTVSKGVLRSIMKDAKLTSSRLRSLLSKKNRRKEQS
jgi:glycosyltransferase involved in cell wall biosynthesis/predicted RNA binding protein YcfA (HicA-like mRNA interferase family)